MDRSTRNQLDYANKCGAKKAIFIGDEELKSGKATVKDLAIRKEEKIDFEKL